MASIRLIKKNEPNVANRQVWFDLRSATDGLTPVLTEAGGQPQISIGSTPWTNSGIGTLTHVGDGRYYAVLDPASVAVGDIYIESRYKSNNTAETPGNVILVQDVTLNDLAATLALSGGTLTSSGGSGVSANYYGTLLEANNFFENRLHEYAWTNAAVDDRPKALLAATRIIDALNYKGNKHTVFVLLNGDPDASVDSIREQEAAQVLEFPRGADTIVPEAVRLACYEIAHSLLDGKDPEAELENLGIVSQGLSSVRTTYSRTQVPIEHIINGIPNATAWRYLRPFLRDDDAIKLSRVS